MILFVCLVTPIVFFLGAAATGEIISRQKPPQMMEETSIVCGLIGGIVGSILAALFVVVTLLIPAEAGAKRFFI